MPTTSSYGELDSIVKRAGCDSDVCCGLTLNVVDIEAGLIDWIDEMEIRKSATRALVGQ